LLFPYELVPMSIIAPSVDKEKAKQKEGAE